MYISLKFSILFLEVKWPPCFEGGVILKKKKKDLASTLAFSNGKDISVTCNTS